MWLMCMMSTRSQWAEVWAVLALGPGVPSCVFWLLDALRAYAYMDFIQADPALRWTAQDIQKDCVSGRPGDSCWSCFREYWQKKAYSTHLHSRSASLYAFARVLGVSANLTDDTPLGARASGVLFLFLCLKGAALVKTKVICLYFVSVFCLLS